MGIYKDENDLFANDVQLFLNEVPIAFAQECKISAKRSYRTVKGYGQENAQAVCVGALHYTIGLNRIEQINETLDFYSASSFSVLIKKQGKAFLFSNCEWINLDEVIKNGEAVIEAVTLVSASLNVTEE
jgi:hypothetical protein